jgi:hypothetical protein|nr:MAG TPA: hypothetical protein [Caudoviricetes sp.]
MKRKDIEKAAGDYSGSSLGFTDNNSVMAKHKAFVDGAEWRINSVWNDANKIPDKAELTLVEFPDGRIDIVYFHTIKSWRSMVKRNGTIRWAYIKDLIPNTED